MTPLQNLILWNLTRQSRQQRKANAFEDPLEQPEWQDLEPLMKLFRRRKKHLPKERC